MKPLRFRYDQDKVMNALAFFGLHGVIGLDHMKSSKLLFLADRVHLLRYGRPITGDSYVCMEHGPVPSATRDLVNARFADDPDFASMSEYFDVQRSAQHPQLVAKREPDMDVFSDSDVEVLTEVVSEYGKKTAWQLRSITHDLPEIEAALAQRKHAKRNVVPIPFESFFGKSEPMIELARQDQEDRDFTESLTW